MPTVTKRLDAGHYNLKDQVVAINRVTKVVKGGKNMSFAALVVVGDPSAAVVGHGAGKAKEVPQAIRKAIEAAKKNLIKVNLTQTSIPHLILGRYGSGKVLLKPAPEGTGVIAGGALRAQCRCTADVSRWEPAELARVHERHRDHGCFRCRFGAG